MTLHWDDRPENDVPFSLARHVLAPVLPDDPGTPLRTALRPFFHYPRRGDDIPVPRIKGELRLPTARRAVRNFRFAGRHLLDSGVDALDITLGRPLTDADNAFVRILTSSMPVTLTFSATSGHRSTSPDGSGVDQETHRVLQALDTVAATAPDQRGGLWCRTMAHYLSSGDPWTACWFAEQVIDRGAAVDPEVAVVVSTAYLFRDAVHTARDYARRALSDACRPSRATGVERARALYTLAITELRHLPASLRHTDSVPTLLSQARDILASLRFDDVASEVVLVENAQALYLLDTGHGEQACATVRATIDRIARHGHRGTNAHAILLSNLGRACARVHGAVGNTEAARALEQSVAIEADHSEGWFDLAHFLAQARRFDEAIAAARSGLALVDMFPDLHDLLGFCLAAIGRHHDAGVAYVDGLLAGGDPAVLGPAGARQFLQAGDVERARSVLSSLPRLDDDRDAAAEVAVLALEAERSTDPEHVTARLTEIAARFPDSTLARQNLEAARAWQAGTSSPATSPPATAP